MGRTRFLAVCSDCQEHTARRAPTAPPLPTTTTTGRGRRTAAGTAVTAATARGGGGRDRSAASVARNPLGTRPSWAGRRGVDGLCPRAPLARTRPRRRAVVVRRQGSPAESSRRSPATKGRGRSSPGRARGLPSRRRRRIGGGRPGVVPPARQGTTAAGEGGAEGHALAVPGESTKKKPRGRGTSPPRPRHRRTWRSARRSASSAPRTGATWRRRRRGRRSSRRPTAAPGWRGRCGGAGSRSRGSSPWCGTCTTSRPRVLPRYPKWRTRCCDRRRSRAASAATATAMALRNRACRRFSSPRSRGRSAATLPSRAPRPRIGERTWGRRS